MRGLRVPRTDDEGVASTLGTTMALLVFLTFMSLIVNQYVPAWMKETEASHTNGVLGQFGGLKSAIDLQILAAHSAANAGRTYIPVTATSAITLGIDGVPVFATPTTSTMSVFPSIGRFTVEFEYEIAFEPQRVSTNSTGSLEIDIHNRYVEPQRIAYENGAILRYQSTGQVIRGPPTFSVNNVNNALEVSIGLVSLFGSGTVSGTQTEVVNSQVFAVDPQTYMNFPLDMRIWMNGTSRYGLAWYQFLNDTLASSLRLGGTFERNSLDVRFTGMKDGVTVYVVSASLNPTNGLYTLRLEIRNNPGVLAIREIRTLRAEVNLGVGEGTT